MLIVTLCLLLGLALWSLSLRRSGLFNNVGNETEAFREHERAWRELGRGREIARLDMLMMVRRYHGTCLSSEANWVTVNLDQRLDLQPAGRDIPIECRFSVRARLPRGLTEVHVWTLFLTPISEERLRLVRVARGQLV